jgi:GMC oxidoreductase
MSELTDTHRAVLTAVCDTVVPAIHRDDDPDGFFARTASDVGVPQALEQMLCAMPEDQRGGLLGLLAALDAHGFTGSSPSAREQILHDVALMGPEAAAGVGALQTITLFFTYGLPDERGQNPNWRTFGYPGPVSAPPATEKPLRPLVPEGDVTLEADVCIVGSGAGGGVMAGVLAERGLKVVVLEAGGYFDDADFLQLELPADQNTYWRGGPTPTGDQNSSIQAGFCLGGGTTINWTNALRTTDTVREQWERAFGLEGLSGPDFERHLDAVSTRTSVNDRCSDLSLPRQPCERGRSGWGGGSRRPIATSTSSATRTTRRATSASATRRAPSRARSRPTCRTPPTTEPRSSPAAGPSG